MVDVECVEGIQPWSQAMLEQSPEIASMIGSQSIESLLESRIPANVLSLIARMVFECTAADGADVDVFDAVLA